jgi:hypothetical protein
VLDLTPKPLLRERRAPSGRPPGKRSGRRPGRSSGLRSKRISASTVSVIVLSAIAAWVVGSAVWTSTRVSLRQDDLVDGAILTGAGAQQLAVRLNFETLAERAAADVTFDGRNARPNITPDGVALIWKPDNLSDGPHRLHVAVPRMFLGDAQWTWRFVVDSKAPAIELQPLQAVDIAQPVLVRGRIDSDAVLSVGGSPVSLGHDGTFTLSFDRPPAGPLVLDAVDRAGNATRTEVVVPVTYPAVRAVHVTTAAWHDDGLRKGIIDLIDEHRINAVELDIKDEAGVVGYPSQVPLAREAGAIRRDIDLPSTVKYFHDRGIRVIGRLVAFRDPLLADYAWTTGHRDLVIQAPNGSPFAGYGGFTNYSNPTVHDYNIDLAVEASKAGVDDILYDYVRRPDGDPATMVVPGLTGSSTDAIVEFLRQSQLRLRPLGTHQGASVFGIAASRPENIAQDVTRMSRYLEFLSPMLYPSHWVDGEYGVRSPKREPANIVTAAMKDFREKVAGTGVALVPWLQDFSYAGVVYGADEVRAQIDASSATGGTGFLLWNAGARYTPGALDPLSP